ncbi:MAG: isochorismatase family cysteine hydrolase [Armatimonadota bacterium]|nr:isochorismatase family cysteine hydrolase [Armatimonadota bacterium]
MPRTIEVPEYVIQDAVTVPAATTALVVVDMQNDFVTPGGALVVPDAARTVPVIAGLLARARSAGVRVFYTQDTHAEGDPEFPIWGVHCSEGTWGWQIVDALAPQPGDRVVRKLRYDGFFGTSLDHELRLAGAQTLVVCGTVANICVLHTAGSAALRGYRVVVPVDAVSALTPFDLEAALRQVHFLYRGTLVHASGLTFAP